MVKIDSDGDGTFETTLTISTDFLLRPSNAGDETPVQPWTEIWLADNYSFPSLSNGRPGVQVTAKFGWPAVPDDIERACLILAMEAFKATAAQGGLVGSADLGFFRVSRMHPVAKSLLAPYRRPSIG